MFTRLLNKIFKKKKKEENIIIFKNTNGQIWFNNKQIKEHVFLLGRTGKGKTIDWEEARKREHKLKIKRKLKEF